MKSNALTIAVVTADQQASRQHPDGVPAALAALSGLGLDQGVLLGFERTVGDEIQGVCGRPEAVVDVVLRLTRLGGWRIGVGIGAAELPLPESTRQARGPAFVAARDAVEDRRSTQLLRLISALEQPPGRTVTPAPYGGLQQAGWYAESALIGLRALAGRRSVQGWEVVELSERGLSQTEIAAELGISDSAVSQRIAAASRDEVTRLAELSVVTLAAAMAVES